jgi:hypothetical protein
MSGVALNPPYLPLKGLGVRGSHTSPGANVRRSRYNLPRTDAVTGAVALKQFYVDGKKDVTGDHSALYPLALSASR